LYDCIHKYKAINILASAKSFPKILQEDSQKMEAVDDAVENGEGVRPEECHHIV
jgi:hypothetical protein